MKKQNILFRADSSSKIGTGHIMRDLVLAGQYKEANIIFASQDLEGNINHKILEVGYGLEKLKSNDCNELLETINKYKIDLLVIDNYDIDWRFEKQVKEHSEVEILSFDDTYERHYCDILLNHNISADINRYKGLVPSGCQLRCGSKYTLLREEFYKEKKGSNREIVTFESSEEIVVFISMGGSDSKNIIPKILEILNGFENIKANVVTTNANKYLKELKDYCIGKNWIELYVNSNRIAKLMGESDFAILTPSVILNEAFFMELPFIAIKTADNQDDVYNYVKKEFLTLNYKEINELKDKIEMLIMNYNMYLNKFDTRKYCE